MPKKIIFPYSGFKRYAGNGSTELIPILGDDGKIYFE